MISCFAKWSILFAVGNCGLPDINGLYNHGIASYYKGQHLDALKHIEKAITMHHQRESFESSCRSHCADFQPEEAMFNESVDTETDHFTSLIYSESCLSQCFTGDVIRIQRARDDVKTELESLYVYNYLQILYHEVGDGIKAADAAHTYLQRYSANEEMINNLDFYKRHYPEVERRAYRQQLIDLEANALTDQLRNAVSAYEDSNHASCVTHFEAVLKLYYSKVEQCKRSCFALPKYMQQHASFWISNGHMEYEAASCRRTCYDNIQPVAFGITFEEPLKIFLHYLQYCYQQTGDVQNAGNASLSKRTLSPTDTVSHQHYDYYQTKYGSIFAIRPDIQAHLTDMKQLDRLLKFYTLQFDN